MPVGVYPGANSAIGNGVTTVFAYSFRILAEADLKVVVDGVEQTLGTHYTVDGVGDALGGSITFLAAPADLSSITIERDRAYVRTIDYQRSGSFDEETVDADFDGVVMLLQQVEASARRAFKAPVEVTADQALTTADWASRASKFVGFTAGGVLTLLSGDVTGVPVENSIQVLDSVAALKALDAPGAAVTYLVRGFAAAGDGGGGFYWWDAADLAADDGGTVLELDAGGVGRFKRLF